MDDADAAEKLRQAAVLIDEMLPMLDTQAERCRECGRRNYRNQTEQKAWQVLTETRRKLLEWADTLYLPEPLRHDSPGHRRAQDRRKRRGGETNG